MEERTMPIREFHIMGCMPGRIGGIIPMPGPAIIIIHLGCIMRIRIRIITGTGGFDVPGIVRGPSRTGMVPGSGRRFVIINPAGC